MTTIALNYRVSRSKIKSAVFSKINFKLFCLVIISFIVAMLAFYIFLVNGLTHGVYVIESYNKETRVLAKENSFLGKVTKKANELSFEKTTKVKYIEMANNSLANAQ